MKSNPSNGVGLLDLFNYFSCGFISLIAIIQSLYYMLFILLSKHKPQRALTHAIKTVFGMGLPSRNRGLGKGRAAKALKKKYFLKNKHLIISERL